MASSWRRKSDYFPLAAKVFAAEERDLERLVLPMLRLSWPNAVGSPARLSFDSKGIDHFAWSGSPPFDLVVQCKGFRAGDLELGKSQIAQCFDSIKKFRESGYNADTYLLIHNRDGRNADFRSAVQGELDGLVAAGVVNRAELWDRHTLLDRTFDAMADFVDSWVASRAATGSDGSADTLDEAELLTKVPLRTSVLKLDQHRLIAEEHIGTGIEDPLEHIVGEPARQLRVLIGEAGFGKTTVCFRAFGTAKVLYVPAARISKETRAAKDLAEQCIDPDDVLAQFEDSDRKLLRRFARPVIENVLKQTDTPLVLVIDGIDESVFFTRRGGIQHLFNMLRDVAVPVVLTARTELWRSKQSDFASSFGATGRGERWFRRDVRLIELLPWEDALLVELTRRRMDAIADQPTRERLGDLLQLFSSGDYASVYGDIPRRPLFLRFILDTVADQGIHKVGRAELFEEWARLKVTRDLTNPLRWSSKGRAPIVSSVEGLDATIELAFVAMECAAAGMVDVKDGTITLLASCSLGDITGCDPRLASIVDPTGLFLNSLLLPVGARSAPAPLRIRFAHRAFQEFFLARHYSQQPGRRPAVPLPDSVLMWLDDATQ